MHEVEVQIRPLLAYHYDEVQKLKQVFDLKPDWDKYYKLDAAGLVISLLAMEDEICIGYAVNFIVPHIHYADQTMSANDVIFVHKAHRSGTAGGRLMAAMRKASKQLNCDVMQYHAKPGTELDTVLAKRLPVHEHIYLDPL